MGLARRTGAQVPVLLLVGSVLSLRPWAGGCEGQTARSGWWERCHHTDMTCSALWISTDQPLWLGKALLLLLQWPAAFCRNQEDYGM